MNWQESIKKELLQLEIKEVLLKIEALNLRLQRLRIEEEEYPSDEEEVLGKETGVIDRDGEEIRTGDRVELLTPSKNKSTFFKGTTDVEVEGVTPRKWIKIRSTLDKSKATTRLGTNLRVQGKK